MAEQTVAQAVAQAIAGLGAQRCFGVVGSGNFHVTNALVAAGVEFVAARHETGAVTMADAHARVTGELTLASVHPGPGIANATTGIAEAAKSRTPLLVLAGDSANGAVRSNFAIDQAALAGAVSATPERLHRPDTAVADALRAAQRAVSERRTVVLNMPLDVQAAPVPAGAREEVAPLPAGLRRPHPAPGDVEQLARLLGRARRPLLLAGRGAVLAGSGPALRDLGERAGALLATTACGHGLLAGDPWCLGIAGGFASPAGVELMGHSDLIVGFGATFTQWTTRHGTLVAGDATVVQIDVELARLGLQRPVDLAIVGDATAVARALLDALDGRPAQAGWRTAETAALMRAGSHDATPYEDTTGNGHIDPRTLTKAVDRLLPDERTVVTDSGHFMGWPARHLRVPDAQGWVFTQSFQSIGLGLATAVGAATARPDRLTVAAVGDGGFLMGVAELETAVRLGQRMLILVYDDAAYAAEVHHFGPAGHPTKTVEFPDVDLAAIARGYGARGVVARTPEDLEPLERWLAGGAEGVFLLDAKVTPDLVADWLEEAFRGEH